MGAKEDSVARSPRRRFLRDLALMLAAGPALGCETGEGDGGGEGDGDGEDDFTVEVLRAYFPPQTRPGAWLLAHAYARDVAGEDPPPAAAVERVRRIIDASASVDEAVERIEQAVVADFEAAAMVTVAGWQLARIEGELVGLVLVVGQ